MRWIALIVLAACGSQKPEPAAPAPGSCGTTTCAGAEICIEISTSPGTPTVPAHTDYTYRCSPVAETDRKYSCGPVANGRQHCTALVP